MYHTNIVHKIKTHERKDMIDMKRFKKSELGGYIDLTTGEKVETSEVIRLLEQEKKVNSDLINSELKQIQEENGIVNKKDTHRFNWNNNKGNPTLFVKSYKSFQRKVSDNMDIFEEGMMSILTRYLESETNKVLVNGESPTNKQLEELTKLGNRKVKEVIRTLKNKKLIATKGKGRGREIYVSPHWAFDGKDISKETLELFNIE